MGSLRKEHLQSLTRIPHSGIITPGDTVCYTNEPNTYGVVVYIAENKASVLWSIQPKQQIYFMPAGVEPGYATHYKRKRPWFSHNPGDNPCGEIVLSHVYKSSMKKETK
jgi:hypothetical protein